MSFNLADLFELVADAVPERLALVAGDKRLTFKELEERATRLGNYFLLRGIKAGDKIGIYSLNRAEWIEAMLAAFKIRAVPININFRYVEDELLYVFDNADLVALVFERQFSPLLINIKNKLPMLKHYLVLEDGADQDYAALCAHPYEKCLSESTSNRCFETRSNDDIYMLYTGGTTGLPKGTVWHHEDIFFGALQGGNPGGEPFTSESSLVEKVKAGAGATTVAPAPMMHGGGEWTSLMTMLSGATYILYCGKHFDADKLCQLMAYEKAMVVLVVGDAMARPIADFLAANPGKYDLTNLFVLSSGGAILSKSIKQQLKTLLPNSMILDSFGASETGHNGTVLEDKEGRDGPCFVLGPHTKILDETTLEPVAPGSDKAGLLARSGHIPQGYYKDEIKTAATFKTDQHGNRWVIPGDWARVETDGTARLLGRGSGCINSGGEKIYPEEVESALKAHPEIFDVAVVGVPCARFTNKVAAVIQLRELPLRGDRSPSLGELAEFCAQSLARYKLPREVIVVNEVPRTPAGKPDYRKVKEIVMSYLNIND